MSNDIVFSYVDPLKYYYSGQASEDRLTWKRVLDKWDGDQSATPLVSAESSIEHDRSKAALALASDDPDRFIELCWYLTPICHDILIQYYILGRTHHQIGSLFFSDRSTVAIKWQIQKGHQIAVKALAVASRFDGPPLESAEPRFRKAWKDMLNWEPRIENRRKLKAHSGLGEFVVIPNGQLGELFAPTWSVLGPCTKEGA